MSIFQEIDSSDPRKLFAEVGAGRKIRTYQKDQVIFEQGDVADTIFYIREGRIKVEVQSEQGREAVVGILGPDHFFGQSCMSGEQLRSATTRAMESSVVTAIAKDVMIALLDEPGISELFIAYLLTRNVRIEADLIDHLSHSSEKRLARVLLLLANFSKDGDIKTIDLTISQETLAGIIGTTRSRVNFFMNKFRKLGLISYNRSGKIEVNSALLKSGIASVVPGQQSASD